MLKEQKNKLTFYLNRMRERGYAAHRVLEGTSLKENAVAQGDFRASADQYRKIISNMIKLTRRPYLGLELGSEVKISDLGVLGYAALSSSTLAQARTVIHRYHRLNEHLVVPQDHVNGDTWICEVKESFPLGNLYSHAVEEFVSRAVTLSSSLTNKPFKPLRLQFSFPEPEHSEKYRRFFDCPVSFNQPHDVIHFDRKRLQDPIALADEDVFSVCDQLCQQLIRQKNDTDAIAERIRYILLNMPGKFLSMEDMAARLSLGPRTLARRLREENTSYQELVNDTRKELAIQYLSHTSLTPKEIAYLVGFSNVSNFRRAFKTWTGKKVSEYR